MAKSLVDLPTIDPENIEGYDKPRDPTKHLDMARAQHHSSLEHLAWAIQNGAKTSSIRTYLEDLRNREGSNLKFKLGAFSKPASNESRFPILYYAVERNAPDIVRALCDAGADPNQSMQPSGSDIAKVPLLAYAVINAEYTLSGTDDMVTTLLGLGADPSNIPKYMWRCYLRAPFRDSLRLSESERTESSWCTAELRQALCNNLNLGQRYSLWKASHTDTLTSRQKQFARVANMPLLYELPYHIIGQQLALEHVIDGIQVYAGIKINTPLIFLFTGPSGHGKSEMVDRMGECLSLEVLQFDCTTIRSEIEAVGFHNRVRKSKFTPQLDDRLIKWVSEHERAVVFLDQFDKTAEDVRKTLLWPLRDGKYTDPKTGEMIDCSKIIWILAANIGVETINDFWTENFKNTDPYQPKKVSFNKLETDLKGDGTKAFGAPLTGLITKIVPFLPFDKGEQAVVAFKFMRNLQLHYETPINTAENKLVGHAHMHFTDDGQTASCLADKGYRMETGAMRIRNTVTSEIGTRFLEAYMEEDGEVDDALNEGPVPKYDVRVVRKGNGSQGIYVERAGWKGVEIDVN